MNNSATASRLNGVVWLFGVVAVVFTLIYLAPLISHLG
jgi:hypothetical protein